MSETKFPTTEIREIKTERLILRPIQISDSEKKNSIFNMPEVNEYLGGCKSTIEETNYYIAGCVLNHTKKINSLSWVITKKSPKSNTELVIGSIDLRRTNPDNQYRCSLGYLLDPQYWGNGYMTESVRAVIDFSFSEISKITSIGILAFAENIGSQKVAEKSGMTLDGIVRDGFNKNGRSFDTCLYTILRKEWLEK